MGEHIVLSPLVGKGIADASDWRNAFGPNIPPGTCLWKRLEGADVPETAAEEYGYFPCYIYATRAELAQMVTAGYVAQVLYEDPDGA